MIEIKIDAEVKNEYVLHEIEVCKNSIKRYIEMEKHADVAVELKEMFKKTFDYINISLYRRWVEINICYDELIHLEPIFVFLEEKDYKKEGDDENKIYKYRSYDYGRIIIRAFPSGKGTCKYVQVDTKTEPVYELQCGGKS